MEGLLFASMCVTLSLFHTLILSHLQAVTPSHFHTFTHFTHFHTNTLSFTCSHFCTFILSHPFTFSHFHTFHPSLFHSLTLSHFHTFELPHFHTSTLSHFYILTLTLLPTYPLTLYLVSHKRFLEISTAKSFLMIPWKVPQNNVSVTSFGVGQLAFPLAVTEMLCFCLPLYRG